MRSILFAFSIIFICNFTFGCNVNSTDCPDKRRRSDHGSVGDPGVHKIRKRATDSKLLQISKGFGPWARLCNAITLRCTLQKPEDNRIIPNIIGELLNLEHGMVSDGLLPFDPTATSDLVKDLRESLTLTDTDLDNIVKEIDTINKFRTDFEAQKSDPGKQKEQFDKINGLKDKGFYSYKTAHEKYTEVSSKLTKFDGAVIGPWNSGVADQVKGSGDDLANAIAAILSPLNSLQPKIQELTDLKPTSSTFEKIPSQVGVYNSFFNRNSSDLFNVKTADQLKGLLQNSTSRENSIRSLRTILYLIEVAQNTGSPKLIDKQYARAFPSGPTDLDLFGKELRSPLFEQLFRTKDDFHNCQKVLEPTVAFGKAVSSAREIIYEKAKLQALKDHTDGILSHLMKLISLGSPTKYSFYVDKISNAVNNPQPPLDGVVLNKFVTKSKTLQTAEKTHQILVTKLTELKDSTDFKWWVNSESKLQTLRDLLKSINGEADYKAVKDNTEYQKIKSISSDFQQKLLDIKDEADKLDPLLTELADFEGLVTRIEKKLNRGFEKFWKNLDGVPESILEVITVAKEQLALPLDDQKATLDDFHSVLEGQIDSINKSLEPLQKSPNPLINWPEWGYRVETEEKLLAGYLVFDYYDKVIKKENELIDFAKKNVEVREQTYAAMGVVPEEVEKRIDFPELNQVKIQDLLETLKVLDQKINSSALKNLTILDDLTMEIALTPDPEVKVSDWIEANQMLIGTPVDQNAVKAALDSCKEVEGMVLDWASHKSHTITGIRGIRKLKWFMHRAYLKSRGVPPERVPKPFSPKDPIFIVLGFLIIFTLIWFFIPIVRWIYEKRYAEAMKKKKRAKEAVRAAEAKAEIKIEKENFYSIKEMYEYRKEVRADWHRKSNETDRLSRLNFRQLLLDERKRGTSFEECIRILAESIQNSYTQTRGTKRSQDECGNYFLNQSGNFVSFSERLYRILKNDILSKKIWQFMAKYRFSVLIDLTTPWSENYQTELNLNIREVPNKILFRSEELPHPFKNFELHKVIQAKTGYSMLYMKYQNFPVGFAPFELTPCQIMFELLDEMRDEDGDIVSVACMDGRDADSRCCIFAMIDSMMFIATHGGELDDLFDIGEMMAEQRLRSLDLLTTVQIEFCIYVCFKIINDESPMGPMFNEDKTEFLRELEDAWASSWLKNYEKYKGHYEAQKMDRIYISSDRDQHFYPENKPKLEEMKESVIKFMERRRAYVLSCGQPDPYQKDTKKQEEEKKKKQ